MSFASVFDPPIPETSSQLIWQDLRGSAQALALAQAIARQSALFVIVTADTQSALRLEQELTFFLPEDTALLPFPDRETLPYDVFSPLPEIVSQRLRTLVRLPDVTRGALVVPLATLMHRLPPRAHLLAHSFAVALGETLALDAIRTRLERAGYPCVSQVYQHGEFAVRGSILDVFPMGAKTPYRIELFDDEVESIRTFDPESQRSLEKIDHIALFPAREFPFTEASIKLFRQQFRQQFAELPQLPALYHDISKGIAIGGIEYYFPLFVEHSETLFDYLPDSAVLILPEQAPHIAATFSDEVMQRYQQRRFDVTRPLLPPENLFLSCDEFHAQCARFRQIYLGTKEAAANAEAFVFDCPPLPNVAFDARAKPATAALQQFLDTYSGRVLLTAETAGHREALIEQLRAGHIKPSAFESWSQFLASDTRLGLVVAALDQGFMLGEPPLALITEAQLSGVKVQQRRRRSGARELGNLLNDLNELTIGAPVVHQEHGVGRYLGLKTLEAGGIKAEYLMLEYANEDKLYVPVSSLHLISRYTGVNPEAAPLHRLGGEQWAKAKKKALERIRDVAAELLDLHARRHIKPGQVFQYETLEYQAFASAFPFEETPDQQSAIDSILADMASPKPMDRIICGDVGFGKTEVAMRAAFVAVQSGKQAAVLVPTTLLAQQHFQNFRDRFADWPIRVEVLSRFVTPKQQKALRDELAQGKIDIIIGTHKLLAKDVAYRALGLLIIDEEHRFGVRQKEQFKHLRSELDILTLTATPIPRTLNMAMSGLRDISIIATPPPNRHPIKTFVSEWSDALIQEACQREIKRGGQVFFLHNDIKTMNKIAREIERLVPEARYAMAHGQMPERELEHIMLEFYHQRFNILLCSTIIESGIDIPSANTIIINRADKLGLAQLHQLRGRVGRSHHRAYAYLITPPKSLLTADAEKRLEAIEASGELGAGFLLASHDLEIRGAGELLGEEQSGQIQEIGFGLYTELLERAVNALRSGKQPELDTPLDSGPEVDLQAPALIPEDYLPDIHTRLVLYKRIANASDDEGLRQLQIEMIDRFGLLPEATKTLFAVTALKQRAAQLGIKKIELHNQGGRVIFHAAPRIDTERLIALLQKEAKTYKLDGPEKLRIVRNFTTTQEKIDFLEQLLQQLSSDHANA